MCVEIRLVDHQRRQPLILRDVLVTGQVLQGIRDSELVLASCDAFDNFPPGLTGKTLALTGKLSRRLFGLFVQQMRLWMMWRLPIAFGWLRKRGDAVTARWLRPLLTQPEIGCNTVRMLRAATADRKLMWPLRTTADLRSPRCC